jgi:hypothetical protein
MNFPNTPIEDQTHAENGLTFKFIGGAWVKQIPVDPPITELTDTTLNTPIINGGTLKGGYVEEEKVVTAVSLSLTVANGSIQHWTLSGNSTLTDALLNGQTITLYINRGTNFTITPPIGIKWVRPGGNGSAPTLATTGDTVIVFWKTKNQLYGTHIGDA